MSDIAITTEQKPASTAPQPFTATAALAALGIVYGDLGTSPLYTLPAIIDGLGGHGRVSPGTGLGVLSLIFWALIITVSVKYCLFVMRADNHGEGGILALTSLVGYAFHITYVLPFNLGSQMALHTSVAFFAYGIAILG